MAEISSARRFAAVSVQHFQESSLSHSDEVIGSDHVLAEYRSAYASDATWSAERY